MRCKFIISLMILGIFFSCNILNSLFEDEPQIILTKPEAVVIFLIGDVEYGGKKLKVGDVVSSDHEIKVLNNALCDLQMIKVKTDMLMRFKSNSTFYLSSLKVNDSLQNTIFIKSGSGIFKVNKLSKEEDYKVVTPTSVAGVRGTFFLVSFIADVAITYVKEGKVTVRPFVGALERSLGGSIQEHKLLTSAYDYFADEEQILEAEQSNQVSKQNLNSKLKDNPDLQTIANQPQPTITTSNTEKVDYSRIEASLEKRKTVSSSNQDSKTKVSKASVQERRVFIDESKGLEFVSKDKLSQPESRKDAIESRNKSNQNNLIDLMANVKKSRIETLILKSGQTIRGIIYEDGKFYIIEQPNGITKVPSKLVKGYVF